MNDPYKIYVEASNVSTDNIKTVSALPFVTETWLHELKVGLNILSLCRKNGVFYRSKIIKISGIDHNKVYTIKSWHGQKKKETFTYIETIKSFLPDTPQTNSYIKIYNAEMRSLINELDLQERQMFVDNNEETAAADEDIKPRIPTLKHVQSLNILYEIDNGKLLSIYPPRYTVAEILEHFQKGTHLLDSLKNVTPDMFFLEFQSYMFSSRNTDATYEKRYAMEYYSNICKSRNITPISNEEILLRAQLLGQWNPQLRLCFVYGVIQLIRYLCTIYQEYFEIEDEDERELDDKECEMNVLVTSLADFIYQNRNVYFREGSDYLTVIGDDGIANTQPHNIVEIYNNENDTIVIGDDTNSEMDSLSPRRNNGESDTIDLDDSNTENNSTPPSDNNRSGASVFNRAFIDLDDESNTENTATLQSDNNGSVGSLLNRTFVDNGMNE
uniref:Uncharacterized protein n=1 Tax=Panagrolaimus sp. ES5 TaxID=591445 RepID=A0AC34F8F1_9BILA